MKRRRYVMDTTAHLAECAANYARLMQLMPDVQQSDAHSFSLSLSGGEPRVCFAVVSRHRYTTVIRVTQDGPQGWHDLSPGLEGLCFAIRIYHDLRCAEVIECQHQHGFKAVYDYPNPHMRHRDEKAQVNRFFGEFLAACLAHGVCTDERVFAHEA